MTILVKAAIKGNGEADTEEGEPKRHKQQLSSGNLAMQDALQRLGGSYDSQLEGDVTTKDLVELARDPDEKKQSKLTLTEKFPRSIQDVANSKILSIVVFSAVFLNGIQMGIETDHAGDEGLAQVFLVLDHFFTAVFAGEFCIKVSAFGKQYFFDRWNVFDFVLTWVSILDMWILGALGAESGMQTLSVLRVFRVFRAVRLLRMLRSLRELTLIVEGLFKAMGTTSWVSLLLLLILYIFSIFCVRSIGREGIYEGWSDDTANYEEVTSFNSYQYFGTISRAMYTLLMLAMMTDDWFVVSRALMEKQPMILVFFLLFMTFTTFGLLNVIMGIVVESVIDCARALNKDEDNLDNKESIDRLQKLYEFIRSLDSSGDNKIDSEELKVAWSTPEMKEIVSMVQLPVGMDADEFLSLIDTDGDASMSTEEIIKSMVRLVTSDANNQRIEMKFQQNRIKCAVGFLSNNVSELSKRMNTFVNDQMCIKQDLECLRNDVSQLATMICNSAATVTASSTSNQNLSFPVHGETSRKSSDEVAELKADIHEVKIMLQNLLARPANDIAPIRPPNEEQDELRAEVRHMKAMIQHLHSSRGNLLEHLVEVREMKALLHHVFRDVGELC